MPSYSVDGATSSAGTHPFDMLRQLRLNLVVTHAMDHEPRLDPELQRSKNGHAEPNIRISPQLSSAQALIRFALRMVILSIFAALGNQGFGKTLESVLALAVCCCIFIAAIRREAPFGPALIHFDEAAAYAVCAHLASSIS
jgi:hypothetical protein